MYRESNDGFRVWFHACVSVSSLSVALFAALFRTQRPTNRWRLLRGRGIGPTMVRRLHLHHVTPRARRQYWSVPGSAAFLAVLGETRKVPAQRFALKLVACDHLDGLAAAKARNEAVAEAELLQSLRHPYIVSCHEVFATPLGGGKTLTHLKRVVREHYRLTVHARCHKLCDPLTCEWEVRELRGLLASRSTSSVVRSGLHGWRRSADLHQMQVCQCSFWLVLGCTVFGVRRS